MEEPLVLAFQFVVHDDPANAGALRVQTLSSGGIDTGELRIVRGFSWLYKARVIRLGALVFSRVPVPFEQCLTRARQCHQRRALAVEDLRCEGDQPLLAQVLQVTVPAVPRRRGRDVARINNAKRADSR
jgi:hypothetical protein